MNTQKTNPQRKSFLIKKSILLAIFLWSVINTGYPEDHARKIKEVKVKIAVDQGFRGPHMWEFKIKRLVSVTSRRFERRFGLKFEIKAFEYWNSDPALVTTWDLLNDLRGKTQQGNCDIVIGFTSRSHPRALLTGIAHYLSGYVLIPAYSSEDTMKKVLGHELGHIFGAIDLDEKGSIMNGKSPGHIFDDFSSHLIQLNKYRSFNPNTFPLPQDRIENIITAFRQRASERAGEYDVHRCLAILYLEKEDYFSAFNACRKALQLKPKSKEIPNLMGIIYRKTEHIDQAILEYTKSFQSHSNVAETHLNLGIAYEQKDMIETAAQEYQKALKLNPYYAKAHANLAHIYLRQGKTEEAIRECRTAIGLNPDSADAHCTLGAALTKGQKILEAEKATLKALSINPRLAPAHNNLAVIHMEKGEFEHSIIEYRKAIDLKPEYAKAYSNLGYAYLKLGRINDAESACSKAIELNPQLSEAHLNLAAVYLKNNQIEKSAVHLHQATENSADCGKAYEELARIFCARKEFDSSWEYLKKAESMGIIIDMQFKASLIRSKESHKFKDNPLEN